MNQTTDAKSIDTTPNLPDRSDPQNTLEHWSESGWAGAVLGSSCWLLISAFFFAQLGWQLTAIGLVCFGLSVGIGIWFWNQRETISYFRAIMTYMACSFVIGLTFWTCLAAFYDNFSFILKGYLAFAVYPLVAVRIGWLGKKQGIA